MKLGNVNLGYLGSINGKEISARDAAELFHNEKVKANPSDDSYSDKIRERGEYSKIVRPYGQVFYVFNTIHGKEVYKVIPLIKNDDIFKWEPAQRYGNFRQHAVIEMGSIIFDLLAYEGEDYHIKVRMKYCGKEIISHDIYGADNDACLREMESILTGLNISSGLCLAKLSIDTHVA